MTGTRQLNTPELVERVKQNRLVEVGDGTLSMSKVLDLERIRLLAPDLIFSSYLGDESGKLREAGFSVVENLQWLESTPLARAEWLKFMALFLNREVEAERLFSSIEERYERAKSRAIAVSRQPTVMCGSDYRGTWFVPGGRTYVAKFIEDAGGNYLWKDDSSLESIPLKMEAVLSRAKNADIWLLHMSSIRSRKELGELEPRNALFSAFKTGEVYNNDAILSAGGGNDYWENGVNNPDLVLLDLIAVLHPDLVPDHRSRWYRKLPEGTLH
jgi:iron complex transport system substrate-binding protein